MLFRANAVKSLMTLCRTMVSNERKDIALEASNDEVRIAVRPATSMAAVPFASDGPEGISAGSESRPRQHGALFPRAPAKSSVT